jgi:hypothetical protein
LQGFGIAEEVFHADQKQMRANHADLSVPLAPPVSAGHRIAYWRQRPKDSDPIGVFCAHLLLICVKYLTCHPATAHAPALGRTRFGTPSLAIG